MIAEEILEPLEMTIDTASSGEMAIEKIKANKYHAVFMDYMMPGMDGVATTSAIRKLSAAAKDSEEAEYYKKIPIIALSGDTSERTQEMFRLAGIDDFTEKPVEFKKLAAMLKKWLPNELINNK